MTRSPTRVTMDRVWANSSWDSSPTTATNTGHYHGLCVIHVLHVHVK